MIETPGLRAGPVRGAADAPSQPSARRIRTAHGCGDSGGVPRRGGVRAFGAWPVTDSAVWSFCSSICFSASTTAAPPAPANGSASRQDGSRSCAVSAIAKPGAGCCSPIGFRWRSRAARAKAPGAVLLRSHGRSLALGRFLPPEERLRLKEAGRPARPSARAALRLTHPAEGRARYPVELHPFLARGRESAARPAHPQGRQARPRPACRDRKLEAALAKPRAEPPQTGSQRHPLALEGRPHQEAHMARQRRRKEIAQAGIDARDGNGSAPAPAARGTAGARSTGEAGRSHWGPLEGTRDGDNRPHGRGDHGTTASGDSIANASEKSS